MATKCSADWLDEINRKVWEEADDGVCHINEDRRLEQVRALAYSMWLAAGGSSEENWLQAEAEVDAALFG